MKASKYAILLISLALLLVLIPTTAWASSRYAPGADATIYVEVIDSTGNPVNNATVVLDLMDSSGNLELDGVSMSYIAGSDGIYKYDFTTPAVEGTYIAVATCAEGQSTTEVQVVSPSGSAGDIWGEDMTGYTNDETFGGSYNINFGGDNMQFLALMFASIALMGFFIWKRHAFLAFGAAGMWVLVAFVAFQNSASGSPAEITDTWMGLFWMGVAFTIISALLPAAMREKPSNDDIYPDEVDEVTGEPIEKEVPKPKRKRTSPFARLGR